MFNHRALLSSGRCLLVNPRSPLECPPYHGVHLQGAAKPGAPGLGPLRVWPGGLCVSRSIGDADAGPDIISLPHIKQVKGVGRKDQGGGGAHYQEESRGRPVK